MCQLRIRCARWKRTRNSQIFLSGPGPENVASIFGSRVRKGRLDIHPLELADLDFEFHHPPNPVGRHAGALALPWVVLDAADTVRAADLSEWRANFVLGQGRNDLILCESRLPLSFLREETKLFTFLLPTIRQNLQASSSSAVGSARRWVNGSPSTLNKVLSSRSPHCRAAWCQRPRRNCCPRRRRKISASSTAGLLRRHWPPSAVGRLAPAPHAAFRQSAGAYPSRQTTAPPRCASTV